MFVLSSLEYANTPLMCSSTLLAAALASKTLKPLVFPPLPSPVVAVLTSLKSSKAIKLVVNGVASKLVICNP
ncbi:MAG: hypothetical protein CBB96_07830 [Gammaproteobacteria bacterium TMED36]|nr:MAG: hypothetical protein CBB96_07830 [Gammaproteobacteria bacterium TMED36]